MTVCAERRFPNRYKVPGLSAEILESTTDGKGRPVAGPLDIVDINHYGALLHGPRPSGSNLSLRLLRNGQRVVESAKVVRLCEPRKGDDQTDYTPAVFDPPLSLCDLRNLGLPTAADARDHPNLWGLLLQDMQLVKDEIMAIERCRSDIFLTIMTAIFLVAVTIGTLVLNQRIHLGSLFLASILTFLMFLLGAITAVEKARALNVRRAFYAVLSGFLRQNWIPVTYQGWATIKYTFLNCGVRRALGICARRVPNKREQVQLDRQHQKAGTQDESCLYLGEEQARPLNEPKNFMPGSTDSFMSTCSYVYTCLYVLSIIVGFIILVNGLPKAVARLASEGPDSVAQQSPAPTGASAASPGTTGLSETPSVGNKERSAASQRMTIQQVGLWLVFYVAGAAASLAFLAKYQKAFLVACGIVILTLVMGGVMFEFRVVEPTPWLPYIVLPAAGFVAGAVGSYLIRTLYSVRKGKNSYDTYYFAWQWAIQQCVPLCENELAGKSVKLKWFNRLLRWVACG